MTQVENIIRYLTIPIEDKPEYSESWLLDTSEIDEYNTIVAGTTTFIVPSYVTDERNEIRLNPDRVPLVVSNSLQRPVYPERIHGVSIANFEFDCPATVSYTMWILQQ
jgi:hypothetical protein